MARQFEHTPSRYGAPMGRASYQDVGPFAKRSISLFRVRLDSGGYDDGGHYWGHGEPIYCARDKHDALQLTTRAHSREQAARNLGLYPECLAKPPTKSDPTNH